MTIPNSNNSARHIDFAGLQSGLIDYAIRVEQMRSTNEVLNELHLVTTRFLPLSVLAAARFPLKSGDWESIELGKSAFVHKDVPPGWWDEYHETAQGKFRPMLYLAASSMASHTWTEARRTFQPIGVDQWTFEVALKHGIRDGLTCPVAGRWVVVFWSPRELSNILTRPMRIMIYAAASFAALQLEQLVDPDPNHVGAHARLTPRELSVLRLVSRGAQFREVAEELGLGEETVRSHLKKSQSKLGARSRTQAVAEAVRQHLIP